MRITPTLPNGCAASVPKDTRLIRTWLITIIYTTNMVNSSVATSSVASLAKLESKCNCTRNVNIVIEIIVASSMDVSSRSQLMPC